MAKPSVSADKVALYDRLIATHPEVQRKGAANLYTSRNGHMFSFLTQEGTLALRLPGDELEAFRRKHGRGPVIQYGAVMREYVEVPDSLFVRTKALAKLFAISYDYIGTLPPKATTRPAKKTTVAAKNKKGAARKAMKRKVVKKTAKRTTAAKNAVKR